MKIYWKFIVLVIIENHINRKNKPKIMKPRTSKETVEEIKKGLMKEFPCGNN